MEELDLKELFMMLWNKKVQIILIILIFAIIGIIYTMGFVTPEYSSYTTLLLAGSGNKNSNTTTITTTDITLNSKLVSTYSVLIKSTDVVSQVVSNLGIDMNVEALKRNISVTSEDDTEVLRITVTDKNPSYAAKIANEIANVFSEKVAEIYNINNVYVVDDAKESTTPSNINHTKDVAIFIAIGIVVSIGYVLIANMLDTTVKTVEDVEKAFKIPVIATIPLDIVEKGGKK